MRIHFKILTITLFQFIVFQHTKAQRLSDNKRLNCISSDSLHGFPIKIDAGSNFYASDTASLKRHNYILVVSANRTAFIKNRSNPDFIYLKQINQGRFPAGDIDTSIFKGGGYLLTLNTKKVGSITAYYDLYEGTLQIRYGVATQIVKVYGEIDNWKLPEKR